MVQVRDAAPHPSAIRTVRDGKLKRPASGIRQRDIPADVDLAALGEANEIFVPKVHGPRHLRIGVVPPEGLVALGGVAGVKRGAGKVEVHPVEGEPGIEAERAPVVNSRRRVALGDLLFAVDAQEALFPVHLPPELLLIEPIELRTRKRHSVGLPRQRRPICGLGLAKAHLRLAIRIDVFRRPGLQDATHLTHPGP